MNFTKDPPQPQPGAYLTRRYDFGTALAVLKDGGRVRRAGWNGKGMWIALTPGSVIEHADARHGAAKLYAEHVSTPPGVADSGVAESARITIGAHIDMRAADGTLVIGWLASQTDMLAEDWEDVS